MRWMTLSIDPVVTRNGNDHEEYSYLTIPSQRCHVWPINEYSGFRFRYCMQGWVMRFSIHVWVFMFGYSCLGIHIQVQNSGKVLRFRYICRYNIEVWVFRLSIEV